MLSDIKAADIKYYIILFAKNRHHFQQHQKWTQIQLMKLDAHP